MIKLIVLLVIVFVGLLFGHTLIGVEGRVIIALPETVIEMSIISSLIIAIFSFIAIVLAWWLIKRIYRAVAGSRNWLGAFSKRQQDNAFFESINAMLLNENDNAAKLINKTMGGDFHGTNSLMAAELAMQAGNNDQAQAYLIQAADEPKSHDIAIMKQAELSLRNGQPEDAMTLLTNIDGKVRNTKAFVLLKLQILASLQDWPEIQNIATGNKKLLGDDYMHWASQCVRGEFAAIASKQGANALKQHWQNLPRGARKDEANQLVYVQLLIDQGLYVDAEQTLIDLSGKRLLSAYYPLFKQLRLSNASASLRFIESEIKKQPDNPALLSVLAHVAFNSDDNELAQKAIRKALELNANKADQALLAKILEKTNDFEGANALYQSLLN